jgi:hypothetical protein
LWHPGFVAPALLPVMKALFLWHSTPASDKRRVKAFGLLLLRAKSQELRAKVYFSKTLHTSALPIHFMSYVSEKV